MFAMESDITPGLASLVVQLQVFITVALSYLLLNVNAVPRQLVTMLIGFCGLLVIFIYMDGYTTVVGLAVVLVAAFSWGGGNLIVKKIGKVDVFAFIAWSSIFAVPPLCLMALLYEDFQTVVGGIVSLSLVGWSSVLWQSIGNMLIGFGLWNLP